MSPVLKASMSGAILSENSSSFKILGPIDLKEHLCTWDSLLIDTGSFSPDAYLNLQPGSLITMFLR